MSPMRALGMLAFVGLVSTASAATTGCNQVSSALEGDNDGIRMEAYPGGNWSIAFVGIKGRATDVVVRFEDGREETYRRPVFQLPSDIEGPADIWLVEYELNGKVHRGPYRFRFDPKAAYTATAKDAFDMLRSQWVTWERLSGQIDILYTGFLMQHSCGIERVEYGFGDEPDQELPMHKCNDPEATSTYSDLRFPVNEKKQVVVRVTFADGTKTETQRFPNPNYGRPVRVEELPVNHTFVDAEDGIVPVYLDGKYECDSPCDIEVPVGDGVAHEIRVKREGYVDISKSWQPKSKSERFPQIGPMKKKPEARPGASPKRTVLSWVVVVSSLEPCWRMSGGAIAVSVEDGVLEEVHWRGCRDARTLVAPFVEPKLPELLGLLDEQLETYGELAEARRSYAGLESPRPDDKKQFEALVVGLGERLPSVARKRDQAKVLASRALDEGGVPRVCETALRELLVATSRVGREFAGGLPIKNLKARERALAKLRVAREWMPMSCDDFEAVVKVVQGGEEDGQFLLDHHEGMRRWGNVWRSKTARVHDTTTRLEGQCLAIFLETSRLIAMQSG